MIIGFRAEKYKFVLITVGYHKSYKIVERTHNIIIFSLAYPILSASPCLLALEAIEPVDDVLLIFPIK